MTSQVEQDACSFKGAYGHNWHQGVKFIRHFHGLHLLISKVIVIGLQNIYLSVQSWVEFCHARANFTGTFKTTVSKSVSLGN